MLYDLILPNNKTIKWRQLDYKFLVEIGKYSALSDSPNVVQKAYEYLVKEKYVDETFSELSHIEQDYVFFKILSGSDEDYIEFDSKCPKCGSPLNIVLSYKEFIELFETKYLNRKNETITSHINGQGYTLYLDFIKNITRDNQAISDIVDKICITHEDDKYFIERKEIEEEVLKLPIKLSRILMTKFTPYKLLQKVIYCNNPNCNKESNLSIDDMSFFLKIFS